MGVATPGETTILRRARYLLRRRQQGGQQISFSRNFGIMVEGLKPRKNAPHRTPAARPWLGPPNGPRSRFEYRTELVEQQARQEQLALSGGGWGEMLEEADVVANGTGAGRLGGVASEAGGSVRGGGALEAGEEAPGGVGGGRGEAAAGIVEGSGGMRGGRRPEGSGNQVTSTPNGRRS